MAPKHQCRQALHDDIHAIAHLGEKALGSGGKSEDQPSKRKKAAAPRCMVLAGTINIFVG
jgi:hypothetical protein